LGSVYRSGWDKVGIPTATPAGCDIQIRTLYISNFTMSSAPRKQAPRLARPAARYWKGKAPKGVADVNSDSDEDEEVLQVEQEGDVLIGGEQDIVAGDDEDEQAEMPMRTESGKLTKSMNIALRDVNISKEGKVIVAGREESGRTVMEEDEDGRPMYNVNFKRLTCYGI
jgi:hypothetical protein